MDIAVAVQVGEGQAGVAEVIPHGPLVAPVHAFGCGLRVKIRIGDVVRRTPVGVIDKGMIVFFFYTLGKQSRATVIAAGALFQLAARGVVGEADLKDVKAHGGQRPQPKPVNEHSS